ncbi:MAG TPA: ThuA domain-containing protein, partial [Cryomorphaceae bacterium]|nr:ThuA domain-containing protein [Cryomorphaceae bacterium]
MLTALFASSQGLKVLHYTETSGYDHGTRNVSLAMFEDLGDVQDFTVDDDQTGDAFNSLENLEQYAVVVFSNTSGNGILSESQRDNFESYINGGGGYIGIHAASDTYRHSTANGGSTGTWDWYAEMAGASVQQSPNHTSANYNGTMDHLTATALLDDIPDPWNKVEEYYYWENGYYNDNNVGILQVQSTGGQTYDEPRPMAWFKELPGGGRSFYTALGHASSNFSNNDDFRKLISNALNWAIGETDVDCAGEPNGTSETDLCGECLENGDENPLWNACVDCHGAPNGDAFEDDCGNCVGGDTGEAPCAGFLNGSVNWNTLCGARSGLLSIYDSGSQNPIEAFELEVSEDGEFVLSDLPIGTFDLYIKVEGFLQKVAIDIAIEAEPTAVDFGTLTPGELSGDNAISVPDFSGFSTAYGTAEGDSNFNQLADFNCDGAINISDYSQ